MRWAFFYFGSGRDSVHCADSGWGLATRKFAQVVRADYDKPSTELYYERLKRAVPGLRQGWQDEHEASDIAL